METISPSEEVGSVQESSLWYQAALVMLTDFGSLAIRNAADPTLVRLLGSMVESGLRANRTGKKAEKVAKWSRYPLRQGLALARSDRVEPIKTTRRSRRWTRRRATASRMLRL